MGYFRHRYKDGAKICTITRKNRKYYYVKFRGPDGNYQNPIATHCMNRVDAVRWAEARLQGENTPPSPTTLSEYSEGFFSDTGRYRTALYVFRRDGIPGNY